MDFGGHNAGDVKFLNDSRLMLTHQVLHGSAATTVENIAAGNVIENVYQEIELRSVENGIQFQSQILAEMGEPSHGAADPAGIVITRTGTRAIALSGIGEILLANEFGVNLDLIDVGNRPVELLLTSDESELLCLNQLSESISIVRIEDRKVEATISLGPTPPESTRERGETLFYDAHVSRFGWYSCHSCHRDGHTIDQLADTFSDGSAGAPKRVLSLLGGRDNNPWAWNGSMRSLHDQVRKSGETTMRGDGFNPRQINDLVAFLHTLESPPPFSPPKNETDRDMIRQGERLFEKLGCQRCHVPPLTYTSDSVNDVGLSDERGQSKFNPPSLRESDIADDCFMMAERRHSEMSLWNLVTNSTMRLTIVTSTP